MPMSNKQGIVCTFGQNKNKVQCVNYSLAHILNLGSFQNHSGYIFVLYANCN